MIKGEGAESEFLNSYGARCARVQARDKMLATMERWRFDRIPPSESILAIMQIEAIINLAQTIEAKVDGSSE